MSDKIIRLVILFSDNDYANTLLKNLFLKREAFDSKHISWIGAFIFERLINKYE